MSTPNFAAILNTKVDEIKRPPLIPVGTYRARMNKPALFGEVSDGAYQTIDFSMVLLEPQLDVDQDDLQKYGGLGANSQLRYRFMFNTAQDADANAGKERTMFAMKKFLADHLQVAGATVNELIANAIGNECLVTVRWRPDRNDPEIQYNEVGRTAPLH